MRIVFMGTPAAAVPSLKRIVSDGHRVIEAWTQPDRPAGRGHGVAAPPVKLAAEELGIPVFQPTTIKSRETRARFKELSADVAVVVAYGRILTKTYLESFRYGCINVHFSLLPKYRGAAPVNWAIANGENKTGVTTMKMDRGMDTGDILLTEEVKIGPRETAEELMGRLAVTGADLLSRTLSDIDEIRPQPQDDAAASYAPLFKKTDGLIDWNLNAKQISDRIRGFQPFPRSYSYLSGARVTFWRALPADGRCDRDPGEITVAGNGELQICCGEESLLRVEEIQLAGKKRVSASEFLNGVGVSTGDRFEDGKI